MNFDEFVSLTKNRKFSVFGIGFAAEMFFQGLISHGCEDNIDCFYVSREIKSETFHGIPVRLLSNYTHDVPLLVAVHPSNTAGISGLSEDAISIYPFLTEYLYGHPVGRNCLLHVSDILAKQKLDEYWIAARYAGIDGIMKNDAHLKELYVRCISLHAERSTAVGRLKRLESLCADISMEGYNNINSPISIDESGRIIDGLHRIALAAYFSAENIFCNIFRDSELFDRLLTDRNKLPEKYLVRSGFSPEDISILQNYRRKLAEL